MLAWNLWVKTDDVIYEPITMMNTSESESPIVNDPWNFASSPDMETWVDFVRFNESYPDVSYQTLDDILPTVMQCKFRWCAQYHGSTKYENGTLFDIPEFDVPIMNDNYLISDPNMHFTNTTSLSPTQEQQFNRTTTVYSIESDFATTFFDTFVSLLQNTVFKAVEKFADQTWNESELLPLRYRPEYDALAADLSKMGRGYSLYYSNEGELSKTMDNIALSVTNSMRSSLGSTNVTGTVEETVVYIQVVWPWLIYSAALIIAAVALLGSTIWLSHGNDKLVWKSSSLALLFHGLPDGEIDGMILSTAKMEKMADGIWARLSEDETGNVKLKIS